VLRSRLRIKGGYEATCHQQASKNILFKEEGSRMKKIVLIFGFIFLAILLMGGSCGGGPNGPKAQLGNVSDTSLSFTARVGLKAEGSFSFENTGAAPLEYTIIENEDFLEIIDGVTGTVVPGSTATVTLEASCVVEGTLNGKISIESNGGNAEINIEVACTVPTPTSNYDIQFEFIGSGMTQARRAVFNEAAVLWSAVITGDLEDVPVAAGELPAGTNVACRFATPEFVGTIDDLLIFASITPIDGEGGVLGQAGPAFIRATTNDLTIVGCMQFDEADVEALEADGTFNEVILHEMGHVLGYGTLWEPSPPSEINLLDEPCQSFPGATSGFIGTQAKIQFGILGRTGNPPVENDYGDGTRCGHWDEGYFDNELMTGFLGGVTSATVNPFSALTIASMRDMGYQVDLTQAEPYSIPACSPTCDNPSITTANLDIPWEIVLKPKGTIGPDGKVTLFSDR
jgi:hypothetical protein